MTSRAAARGLEPLESLAGLRVGSRVAVLRAGLWYGRAGTVQSLVPQTAPRTVFFLSKRFTDCIP